MKSSVLVLYDQQFYFYFLKSAPTSQAFVDDKNAVLILVVQLAVPSAVFFFFSNVCRLIKLVIVS